MEPGDALMWKNAARPAIVAVMWVALASGSVAFAAAPSADQKAVIADLQKARVAPVDAIKTADAIGMGSAIAYAYDANGGGSYRVTLAANPGASGSKAGELASQTGVAEVALDPATGNVLLIRAVDPNSLAGDGLPGTEIGPALAAQKNLADALQAVQQQEKGPVLKANYAMRPGSNLSIEVAVAVNGAVTSYRVDPQTGQVSVIPPGQPGQSAQPASQPAGGSPPPQGQPAPAAAKP
jgi:hypothetical protein